MEGNYFQIVCRSVVLFSKCYKVHFVIQKTYVIRYVTKKNIYIYIFRLRLISEHLRTTAKLKAYMLKKKLKRLVSFLGHRYI